MREIQAERARRRLEPFTTYTYPRYVVEPAHSLIARTLDRLIAGDGKRLMIFAPPQHGKSELASVRLPAFWLGRRPDDPVILTSYAAGHAEFLSRKARECVESEEFAEVFHGVGTDPSSRAVDFWKIGRRRGYVVAAGVGGPITGKGAMLGIVDDPFENWEQAQSQVIRDKVWDWYRTTFRTRIWEDGAIVLIMTRWHQDDVAGRLLNEQGDRWDVLRLPAVAESQDERDQASKLLKLPQGLPEPLGRQPGEPLCPKRFSAQALAELKTDVGPIAWPGQYQGVPHEPEGNLFKRHWWKRWRDTGGAYRLIGRPGEPDKIVYHKDCLRFVICDPSQSKKGLGDNVAFGCFDLTKENDLLVVDVQCEQMPLEAIVENLLGFCGHWRPEYVGIEDSFEQVEIVREARACPGMPPVKALSTEGKDKLVRATAAVVRCSAGQIYLPHYAPWVEAYIEEHAQFTGNDDPHDDQVDITAYAARQQRSGQIQGRQNFKPQAIARAL